MRQKSTPLTHEEARHLARRALFSCSPSRIEEMVGRTAEDVVTEWVTGPVDTGFLLQPAWVPTPYPPATATREEVDAFLASNDYYVTETRSLFLHELIRGSFRARMALFWHDHFVTDVRKYRYASLAFRYTQLLMASAFGRLPSFVEAISTDGAMLYYLDGRYSTRTAPNENFARELMELFTMGQFGPDGSPNYTQEDIREMARALTGWRMSVRDQWNSYFQPYYFDYGQKTIFGRTGVFDKAGVIRLLFEERAEPIAHYMAGKLLAEFVHPEPAAEMVGELAAAMLAREFDMGMTMVDLLSSEAFFDLQFRGTRIKQPVELMALHLSVGDAQTDPVAQGPIRKVDEQGQQLLAPPNVAGWPGHRTWLNTDLLPRRWSSTDWATGTGMKSADHDRVAAAMVPSASEYPAVDFALNLAEHVFPIDLSQVSIPEVDEPFGGDLVTHPLPQELIDGPRHRQDLVKLMLAGTPWYEWSPQTPLGRALMIGYYRQLAQYPEYQLS